MKIAIIGTGMVGRAFALKLQSLGHQVRLGTRDVKATLRRTEADSKGTCGYAIFAKENPQIPLMSFNESVKECAIIINASEGIYSVEIFRNIEPKNLEGKIVLDLALPLAFSPNRPPHIAFANDDSLGEQIQRLLPKSFVVKTLNTMPYSLMLNPQILEGNHNAFISGDNIEAKEKVISILESFGWNRENIIDLSGIISARATEMYANLLFSIANKLGTYDFNIAVRKKS